MAKNIRIKCLSDYQNFGRKISFVGGQVYELDEPLVAFLMRDAPGCFIAYKEEVGPVKGIETPVKDVEAPPKDKMLKAPRLRKGKK